MKSSTKVALGVAVGGLLIRDIILRAAAAIPVPPKPSQLNGYIDPFALGLGCDCDLGFVGCADMGVAPARSGIGSLQRPEKIMWDKTSVRPKHWQGKNPKHFVLDGVGLAGFISPLTEQRVDTPGVYPWATTGYDSLNGADHDGGGDDGLGRFSFKKAFQQFTAPVKKTVTKVTAAPKKFVARGESLMLKPFQAANKVIKQQVSKVANIIKTETYEKPKAVFGRKKGGDNGPAAAVDNSGNVVYQDENGNVITKAQYDAQMSASYQTPGIVSDPAPAAAPADFTADEATGGSVYDNMQTDSGGTFDSANTFDSPATQAAIDASSNDQNWRTNQGDGFVSSNFDSAPGYNSGSSDGVSDDGVITSNGVSWWQDTDGTWYWFDETAQDWVQDEPDGTYVAEVASPMDASEGDVQFDGSNELGHLYDRRSGRPLAVVTRRGRGASINPLKVDGKGRVFASNGRKQRQVGTVDLMAKAEGQAGLGFSIFGRSFSKFSDFAKDVASKATPSGAIYKMVKRRSPSKTTEFHKTVKTATPYAAIAAGTIITIGSIGLASPAGVALIAGGVAEAAAQGYSDVKTHQAAKDIQAINDQSAADVASINTQANPSPAQQEAAALPGIEQQRLAQASYGAHESAYSLPILDWSWWMGDIDEQSAATYGEQLQSVGI